MTTGTTASALDSVIAVIDEFFDGVFAPLEEWRPRLAAQVEQATASGPLTGGQLATLIESDADRILDDARLPLYGVGYCAAEHIVASGNPLAWWQGPDRALLASSTFGPGQAAIDLGRLEWFRVPQSTGDPHVAGPFVDYLCSNEITVTSSLPVELSGVFSGVICADVLVSELECIVMPSLASIPDAVLVNTSGRVAVSTAPDIETGDRFSEPVASELRAASERYPFAVIAGARVNVA